MTATEHKAADNLVYCRDSQGLEVRANLLKVTPFQVVFEAFGPVCVLRASEVLRDFKILLQGRPVYFGQAVVTNLIDMGGALLCEAALQQSWIDQDSVQVALGADEVRSGFEKFMQQWQKHYKVTPEYKVIVADMQAYMADLKVWLDQVELRFRSLAGENRLKAEQVAVRELEQSTTPVLNLLFQKFEETCRNIDPEVAPVHAAFCRRQLHPLLMASPFMHRIFAKPLGYAGDYEMVNMLLRDSCEGGSLFGKLLNIFILSQVPAVAHRNRVAYLTRRLMEEANRRFQAGRTARVLNFGCGPAKEVQDFLAQHALCDHAQIELVDFEDDALAHVTQVTGDLKSRHRRRTLLKPIKKSVQQVLRHVGKPVGESGQYDFVYCAGLFDYLSSRTCRTLVAHFYDLLAPGGLLVITNVEDQHPIRNIMEHIYEWRLICRSRKELAGLAPEPAPPDAVSVQMDSSGGNIFLEVRKPLTAQ